MRQRLLDASGNPIGNNNVAQGSIFVIFGAARYQPAGIQRNIRLYH